MALDPGVLSLSFNQAGDCLAVGTPTGFTLLHTAPALKETLSRDLGTGLRVCEMLFTTNLLAVVGSGSDRWPPNKVLLWDDHTRRCSGELNFKSDVRAVRLRRDLIVVVLSHKTYVYDFTDLRCVDGIETLANPTGLCALSTAAGAACVLACPGLNRGGVRIDWFDAQPGSSSAAPRVVKDPARRTRFLTAHDSPLAALALTSDGGRLATASEKGTLVRIFDTQSGAPVCELRRGLDPACIWSLAWSPDGLWCAATSDKGTAHVWSVPSATPPDAESREGALALVRSVLPVSASAQRSCLQIRLQPARSTAFSAGGASVASAPRSVAALTTDEDGHIHLLVASYDGVFHSCAFTAASPGAAQRPVSVRFAGDAASCVDSPDVLIDG